ncbi:cytochrome c (plasmid) [Skermanella rosea]|uniref:c-type cytochrome n=1 Tax=Skermanella rosea TaxID=1817965 RepID=UPI001931F9E5|nr:cytochrome c [Skermanella rosea]UEM07870.1 cytochrome c [Skermanella rosea]
MQRLPLVVATVLAAFTIQAAGAQTVGSQVRGRERADQLCGDCHVVAPGREGSRSLGPNLVEYVRDPAITEMALRSYLQTSHPVMPNVMLDRNDTDDIVAYLLAQKEPRK